MAKSFSRHPKVDLDIDQLADYISLEDVEAALRFVDATETAIKLIATTPELGPVFPTEIEKLKGFAFTQSRFQILAETAGISFFTNLTPKVAFGCSTFFIGSRDIPAHLKKDVRY